MDLKEDTNMILVIIILLVLITVICLAGFYLNRDWKEPDSNCGLCEGSGEYIDGLEDPPHRCICTYKNRINGGTA